jgi:hypothetical protein
VSQLHTSQEDIPDSHKRTEVLKAPQAWCHRCRAQYMRSPTTSSKCETAREFCLELIHWQALPLPRPHPPIPVCSECRRVQAVCVHDDLLYIPTLGLTATFPPANVDRPMEGEVLGPWNAKYWNGGSIDICGQYDTDANQDLEDTPMMEDVNRLTSRLENICRELINTRAAIDACCDAMDAIATKRRRRCRELGK